MPRTASPAVSVIVPLIARADLHERAGAQLRAQTLTDIEILLVGGEPGMDSIDSLRADDRVRRIAPGPGQVEAMNAGLDACRGERVFFLDPHDELRPQTLEALAVRMRHGGEAGAFGGFRFHAPIGELPGDPLQDVPDSIGFDELVHCQWFPLSAMMLEIAAIGGNRFNSSLAGGGLLHPADYDWLLRLAQKGVRWSRSTVRTASIWVRPIKQASAIARALASRVRLQHEHMLATGASFKSICEHAQDAVNAHVGLCADSDDPPTYYSAQETSGAEMARWWQRLGFVGRAPQHLLPTVCKQRKKEQTPNIPEKARAAAELLDPVRPIVLVGHGPAITHFAGVASGLGAVLRVIEKATHSLSVDSIQDPRVLARPEDAPINAQFVASTREQANNLLPDRESLIIDESHPQDRPPHLLQNSGEMPASPPPRGLLALPALLASQIVSELDGASPIVLIGLGRNARRIARILTRRQIEFAGFDHSMRMPDWTDIDGIPLKLLTTIPSHGAQLVLPVVHDVSILQRLATELPVSARVARWSLAAEVLCHMRPSVWMTIGQCIDEIDRSTEPRVRSAA